MHAQPAGTQDWRQCDVTPATPKHMPLHSAGHCTCSAAAANMQTRGRARGALLCVHVCVCVCGERGEGGGQAPTFLRWKNFFRYHSCQSVAHTHTPSEKMEYQATRPLVISTQAGGSGGGRRRRSVGLVQECVVGGWRRIPCAYNAPTGVSLPAEAVLLFPCRSLLANRFHTHHHATQPARAAPMSPAVGPRPHPSSCQALPLRSRISCSRCCSCSISA